MENIEKGRLMTPSELKQTRAEFGRLLGIEMTQARMAEALHVSRSMYQKWEISAGRHPIPEWVPELVGYKLKDLQRMRRKRP